jgi:hypothetical protein
VGAEKIMARKHKEYSLFLRPTKVGRSVYHVKLWDVKARRYSVSRSTGETDHDEALLKVPGIQQEIEVVPQPVVSVA